MIVSPLHPGSGLGDQIFCYLAARISALRLNTDYGMLGEFKGKDFMEIDKGIEVPLEYDVQYPARKIVVQSTFPVYEGEKWYDPEFSFIEDNTIVDGCKLQDERYFEGHWHRIREWLKTEPLEVSEDTCVVNFRGGEFATVPELFLPKSYWDEAVQTMRNKGFENFQVHTDDIALAKQFFPDFECIHDLATNWRSVRYAKAAIIGNSAFNIIPRLLAHHENKFSVTVAPHYWARRNIQEWSTVQNYYKDFLYL